MIQDSAGSRPGNHRLRQRRSVWLRLVVVTAVLSFLALDVDAIAGTTSAEVELWRLDCGEVVDVPLDLMSDVFAYPGQKNTLTNSCYLIRHHDDYMLWDTGLRPDELGVGHKTLVQQLAHIGVVPEKITVIGISHFHYDHTGQASLFPAARLLIGEQDLDLLVRGVQLGRREDLQPWLTSGEKVDRVVGDKDIFGDGTVVMLSTPGHTMGHHSLLVRLAQRNVVLSGDLWHFAAQVPRNGVPIPGGTMDRAAALASMDRITQATTNLNALLIIQHEPADIEKLPKFPLSAK
jgi:N-acyl homoserine lactone hydrolase